jgi:hypothetical protein
MSAPFGPRLPRDFIGEIEDELARVRACLAVDRERLLGLSELYAIARATAAEFGAQITVFDVVDAASGRAERERRLRLVRLMRTLPPRADP